jgi:hypothetical protein
MVAEQVARRSDLASDRRQPANVRSTLKESRAHIVASQQLKQTRSGFTRSVVERERNGPAVSNATMEGRRQQSR